MRIDHLIQAYNFNRIPSKIKEEVENENEHAGVINFYNGITGSYLLDDEEVVIAIKIFFNCLTIDEKNISNQLNHTIKILNVRQKTIMALDNVSQEECNMILDKLGLFDDTFKDGKQIKHLEHSYRLEVIDGLLCMTIEEIN